MLVSMLMLLVGHTATSFRHVPNWQSAIAKVSGNDLKPARWLVVLYTSWILWMLVSLLWSPAPKLGIIDAVLLGVLPIFAVIFAVEFSKTVLVRFPTLVVVGFSIATILLALELADITQIHALNDPDARKYDLNRNAAQAILIFWPVLYVFLAKGVSREFSVIPIVSLLTMCWLTESQSAQMAIIVALTCWLILNLFPRSIPVLSSSLIAFFVLFPLLIPSLTDLTEGSRADVGLPASAEHRIQLWRGHVEPILENPLFGYGAKANRTMGSVGEFGAFAREKGFHGNTTHPHNFSLEFWIDFGLVGILLLAGVLLSIVALISRLDLAYRNISMSLMVGGIAFSFSGAGFMQLWWLSAISMSIAGLVGSHLVMQRSHP